MIERSIYNTIVIRPNNKQKLNRMKENINDVIWLKFKDLKFFMKYKFLWTNIISHKLWVRWAINYIVASNKQLSRGIFLSSQKDYWYCCLCMSQVINCKFEKWWYVNAPCRIPWYKHFLLLDFAHTEFEVY